MTGYSAQNICYFSNKVLIVKNDYIPGFTSFDIATGKQQPFHVAIDNIPTYINFSPDLRYIAGVDYGGGDLHNAQPQILRLYKQ